jgi:hypothetical protein
MDERFTKGEVLAIWAALAALFLAILLVTSCASISDRQIVFADDNFGVSVELDETRRPVSIYVEGAPGAESDAWRIDTGRTGDGRPYLLVERD